MPTTLQMLKGHSPKLLEVISENRSAGVDFLDDRAEFEKILAAELTSPASVQNVCEELADNLEVQKAMDALVAVNGIMPLDQFTNRFGELEIMGDARLAETERWLTPRSVSELLYYNGLLGRSFEGIGPEAYPIVYMPSDIVDQMPRPALPGDEARLQVVSTTPPSQDQILDMEGYLLSDLGSVIGTVYQESLRLGQQELRQEDDQRLSERLLALPDTPDLAVRKRLLLHIAKGLGLFKREVDKKGMDCLALNNNQVRAFLDLDRHGQCTRMWNVWRQSRNWNDLGEVPVLDFHNTERWQNHPAATRAAFLDLCRDLAMGQWYRVEDIVTAIYNQAPDFQRPGGSYDQWYIRHEEHQAFARGYEHWDWVEGELVRFLLQHTLHWLGALRLAILADGSWAVSLTRAGAIWLGHDLEPEGRRDQPRITIGSNYLLRLPLSLPLKLRFRIERFAMWKESGVEYVYQINQRSLERAFREGLTAERILKALQEMSRHVPESMARAIQRFAAKSP